MEHNNDREDNKSKSKKPNRRPRDKRSTCRHFLEGRCTYGRENCNFPHRDGELRPEMVAAAAQQEEEVALAEARYNANANAHAHALYSSTVTYNSGLYVNGHYVNHGHYTNNGRVNNSHHQLPPPPPPPQWMGYRIANPMPNALGRPTFDGTQEEATSYFDSPLPPYAGPSSHAGPSRPPPGYAPPEYGAPVPYYAPPHHHGRHGHGHAGPSFPPPDLPLPLPGPPLDPMGMSRRPTHQPRPLGPPPGFGPGPSNALAPPPSFEPALGPGAYPPSPSPAPPYPHHGLELASAAVAASPAPEEAPVPNTAPAATVAGPAQDPSTIRCWYGLGCKRPGCHFRHDGGRDGHVVNGEASGSGSANANGDGDEGYEGDGDDVSMSESSGSVYVPPPPASEDFHAAATPQSSPRQLPDSVAGGVTPPPVGGDVTSSSAAGDVTPPSVGGGVTSSSAAGDVTPPSPEHTSEEHSAEEGEGDAEQPAAEEETPEAEHPEEEKKEEKKEEEEKQVPAPADTVQQPAARRPGPAVVDGRSAWGLGLVKADAPYAYRRGGTHLGDRRSGGTCLLATALSYQEVEITPSPPFQDCNETFVLIV